MTGTVDILNCKLGDLKLSFDPANPVEAERAGRAVRKMLRDGFVIFVEVDGQLRRVTDFDPACNCYLITDVPGQSNAAAAEIPVSPPEPEVTPDADRPTAKRGRGRPRKVDAAGARATAVAPRSGG